MSVNIFDVMKQRQEIQLVVKGRKTGRETSRPVWFVLQRDELFLLPVTGAKTQWFRNILQNPQVKITVGGKTVSGRLDLIREKNRVGEVVNLFRSKYGERDIKKYYTRLEVAAALKVT